MSEKEKVPVNKNIRKPTSKKSFSLELCNPGGIDCSECLVTSDTLENTMIELCQNDPALAFEPVLDLYCNHLFLVS